MKTNKTYTGMMGERAWLYYAYVKAKKKKKQVDVAPAEVPADAEVPQLPSESKKKSPQDLNEDAPAKYWEITVSDEDDRGFSVVVSAQSKERAVEIALARGYLEGKWDARDAEVREVTKKEFDEFKSMEMKG